MQTITLLISEGKVKNCLSGLIYNTYAVTIQRPGRKDIMSDPRRYMKSIADRICNFLNLLYLSFYLLYSPENNICYSHRCIIYIYISMDILNIDYAFVMARFPRCVLQTGVSANRVI